MMKRLTSVFLILSLALLSGMAPGFTAAAAEESEAEWRILDNLRAIAIQNLILEPIENQTS